MYNEPNDNDDFGFDNNDENRFDEIYENENYYDNDNDFEMLDEGSDRDNWETEQVFQDREFE